MNFYNDSFCEVVLSSEYKKVDVFGAFCTEKEWRPFLMCVIPMIVMFDDYDKYLKYAGYDLFEDVIDTSFYHNDNLQQKFYIFKENFKIIENDLILTSGEAVSVGLLSAILKKRNIKSIPILGWQIPIITDSNHQKAKILNIDKVRIDKYLNDYDVLVVAGFQGVDIDGKITSLGRGGSDTTAVAVAAAVDADRCDIYTDVDGVYSTDPNLEPKAKKINKLAFEEMLEMSSTGAKVLHTRSVELAMKNNLTLQVLSSITKQSGTLVVDENKLIEKEIVSGVSFSNNESKLTLSGIADKPCLLYTSDAADEGLGVDLGGRRII